MYEDPGNATLGSATSQWGPSSYIWKLGYDPSHWEQAADPKVKSTVVRDGNFDYLTNQVQWDQSPVTLPPSLYLRGKPAFFGSALWPWVNPTGGTKLGVLPARRRFDKALGTTSDPGQADSGQADPDGQPCKDNPGKGDPGKDNPGKDDPGKDNPGKGNAG